MAPRRNVCEPVLRAVKVRITLFPAVVVPISLSQLPL